MSGERMSGERTCGEHTERMSGERTSGERTGGERTGGERTGNEGCDQGWGRDGGAEGSVGTHEVQAMVNYDRGGAVGVSWSERGANTPG